MYTASPIFPTKRYIANLICGLGSGLEPATQGLASSLIDPAYNARMFTTVAVLDTLAKLLGGPLAAALYSIRPSLEEPSSGFNFLGTSVSFHTERVGSWRNANGFLGYLWTIGCFGVRDEGGCVGDGS